MSGPSVMAMPCSQPSIRVDARSYLPHAGPAIATFVVGLLILILADRSTCDGQVPAAHAAAADENATRHDDRFQKHVLPLVRTFCAECHNTDDATADIALDAYTTPQAVMDDRPTWERVFRMLNADAMPPHDHRPRPDTDERNAALEWLHNKLFNFDCNQIMTRDGLRSAA